MNYVKTLDKIYQSVEQTASAVCSLTGEVPKGTLVPISDKPYVFGDFTKKTKEEVDAEIKEVISSNGYILDSNKFFFGVWTDKNLNLHMDVCVAHLELESAFKHAITIGIDHLIVTDGLKYPMRVPIPSPQTVGSITQQNAYTDVAAKQLVNKVMKINGQ